MPGASQEHQQALLLPHALHWLTGHAAAAPLHHHSRALTYPPIPPPPPLQAWDVQTLKCAKTLEGHEDNVRVLSVGDNFMFSGSWDKTIRVWDLGTLECIKTLEGHTEAVLALAVGECPGAAGGGGAHVCLPLPVHLQD